MKSFLFTEITEFPFGWDMVYQEALRDFPAGKQVEYEWEEPRFGIEKWTVSYFTDPVAFRKMLITTYEKTRQEALGHYENAQRNGGLDSISTLLYMDILLYQLALEWILDAKHVEDHGDHYFNPILFFRNEDVMRPSGGYFHDHYIEPWAMLNEYRIIRWYLPLDSRRRS